MSSDPNIRQIDAADLEKLIPAEIDVAAFKSLALVSRYGWKIIDLDGKKYIAAGTEADYEAFWKAGFPSKPIPKIDCYSDYGFDCRGAPCCRLWYDMRNQYWVCSC